MIFSEEEGGIELAVIKHLPFAGVRRQITFHLLL
jgi:hypothetical protein